MNSEEKTDYELIDEAIDGNEAAYGIIMERYRNSLHGIIYRMVRNQEETQDLVQEAFIKAYNALSSFNKQYSFSTWLFKIASNNCIDHLRKKRLNTTSIDRPIETKDGSITNIQGYDSYVDSIFKLAVAKFMNREKVVIVPNLSYYPRAGFLPKNSITDGSLAILTPKN